MIDGEATACCCRNRPPFSSVIRMGPYAGQVELGPTIQHGLSNEGVGFEWLAA